MRAMLDTCAVVDFEHHVDALPDEIGISSIVIAELEAGVATQPPGSGRTERLDRLKWALTFLDPQPFTQNEAAAYGRLVMALRRAGRSERSRIADMMIAATAAARNLPLYTTNADDFVGVDQLVEIVVLEVPS